MNVAFLQHTFNPTTMGWVRGLEARGHRVLTIIADPKEPLGGWPEDLTVEVVPDSDGRAARLARRLLPGRRGPVRSLPPLAPMVRVLRRSGTDAVIVKVYSLRNVVVLLLALALRIRRIAWIEQAAPPNREWRVLRRLGVLPRRMFTALDARPGGVAEPLDRPAGGLDVITYAPVVPAVGRAPRPPGHPVRILTVAAFWDLEPKRAHWTLEAAGEAGLLDGSVHLTFVGLGREDSPGLRMLLARIGDLGAAPHVTVQRNVPYLDMGDIYAANDLLVLPSSREQFGMAVPEAMAHGLAVVASDCVGAVGCIVPGVTGELFVTSDRSDLARVLRSLADDPERIARIGAAGREFITRHGSPEVTAELLERLLRP
jgi:glycosyltransferase involved in cell wall biosynthesis